MYGVLRFGWTLGTRHSLMMYGLPLIIAACLLLATRLAASIQTTIVMVIVPLGLAILTAELILTVPDRQELQLMGARMVWRDNRAVAISRLRERGINAHYFITPQEFGYGESTFARGRAPFIALGGISGTVTLLCNESGTDVIYTSDEHGFNNPTGIWNDSVDVALVGDSFVQGECVASGQQLASLVRQANPRTLNAGVAGAGPLSGLAVLREYVKEKRPSKVVWFFYEGNDMEDLAAEARSPLARYADPRYSQRLFDRRSAIDSALEQHGDSVVRSGPRRFTGREKLRKVLLLRGLRGALGLDAAGRPATPRHDYELLGATLNQAKQEVEAWGGRMYFAYLPERRRYDPRMAPSIGEDHNPTAVHRAVIEQVSRAGLPVIDLTPVFAAHPEPLSLWIWRRSHYSAEGYRIAADAVIEKLRIE